MSDNEYDDDPPTPRHGRPPLTLEDSQSRRRTEQLAQQLLEDDMAPEQRRLAVRMRSHSRDPYDLLARMAAVVDRLELKHDSGAQERNAAAETLLAVPRTVSGMDVRVKSLEGDVKFAKRAAQGVIVFVLVSSFGAAWWLWGRGEAAGVDKQRLQQMEHQIERLEGQRWPQAMKDTSP